MPSLVTLTTDFGTRDPYVAAMKGVLLRTCPELRVLDLGHEISPHDVLEGSLFLAGALPHFPAGTVHIAVVDPGVGGERRPIAVRAGGQTVVCPDNGLLTLFLRAYEQEAAHVIANVEFMAAGISATFHGRDIFAPAAARLACGAPLDAAGPPLESIVTLDVPEPRRAAGDAVHGEVIHVDRFGNAITNIPRAMVESIERAKIHVAGRSLGGLRRTYADGAAGQALALIGSTGHVEIAVSGGSAATVLGLRRGDGVEFTDG